MQDLTVFISYRRADSSADAGRLYDALRRRFGRENLFMDVDSLRPGEDWVDAVEAAVTRCDVLLAVIGPSWVSTADADGIRRLHKELDRVRLEIEAALRHNKPVIPVLVEGAAMPQTDDLPETLRPLLRRHAIRVSHQTFESDLGALVRALRIIDRARGGRGIATRGADDAAATTVTPAVMAAGEYAAPPAAAAGLPPLAPPPTGAAGYSTLGVSPAGAPAPPADVQPATAPMPIAGLPAPPSTPPPPPAYGAPPPAYAPRPAYVPPSAPTQPAYGYTQPAYGYNAPDRRSGPSGVLVGLLALGLVLIVGVGAMFAFGIGPFGGTGIASPTPRLTLAPTAVLTTAPTPTVAPTASPTLVPTATASLPPTASPLTPTATPVSGVIGQLQVLLPTGIAEHCEEDDDAETPRLYCYVPDIDPDATDSQGASFWYELYADEDLLKDEYESWLTYWEVETEVADCFADSGPVPCEWAYKVGGIDPAGRVFGAVEPDYGWIYWTHTPSLLFGHGLMSGLDSGNTFAQLFSYWKSTASAVNYTPAP